MTVREQPVVYNADAFANAMEEFSKFFHAMASSTRALISLNEDMATEIQEKQAKIDAMDSTIPTQPKLETPVQESVDPVKVEPIPETPANDPLPTITFEEIQAMAKNLAFKGKSKQIHDILQQYGAIKLSDIDPKYYVAFSVDLKNIGD